jgi:hypothetical protein
MRRARGAPASGIGATETAGGRQGRPQRAQREPSGREGALCRDRPGAAPDRRRGGKRRAGAHLIRAGGALRARDQVGLRALNEALKNAFDTPGKAGFAPGGRASARPPATPIETTEASAGPASNSGAGSLAAERAPLRFKQALVRLHPGERRGVSLLIDPQRIAAGTIVHVAVDPGLGISLWWDAVPEPNRSGWSRIDANLRCRASAEPGARLSVLAEAAGHTAELVVLVVRHHANGWVREIARKDEDAEIEAHFDPEAGIVTVYEGRREFRALERAARRSGLPKARVREYLPYRMLEVEVAANTVYTWAAEEIVARRLAEERPSDPADYAVAVRHEAQALRYRTHEKLMRAFLDDAVYDGRVRVQSEAQGRTAQQSLHAT